ncbi:thiamine phosphate synthase [Chloroflexota bacterium]
MDLSESISRQTLRIIDASLNRVGEGLRFLEEIARLLLDEVVLTEQLKTMRHKLIESDHLFQQRLLQSRNSAGDVGMDIEVSGEGESKDLSLLLVANARRVQESLRTLEELTKVPAFNYNLDSGKFKQARFALYTIEQKLFSRLLRQEKLKHISGLYVIIDTEALEGCHHVEVASQAIHSGAGTIQLRDKVTSKGKLLLVAKQLRDLCAERGALFIVNEHLDVALATDADGLHLESGNLPIAVVRELLPLGKVLGCSVATVDQAATAQSDGADYIVVGPVYPTLSREEVVGLERLRQIKEVVSLPLVAVGGITKDKVSEVIAAGADSVAVISTILDSGSLEETSRQIVDILETRK